MDDTTYQGDARLGELLAAAGSRCGVEEVVELIRGVNAAPEGYDSDAWMELVVPEEPGPELRGQLRALRATLAGESAPEPPVAERLARLRAELERQGLAGFILPLTDEHGSEYLPANARRLSWLTGFTGSAGTVVVLRDEAALFVDGRYTLQAEAEVDSALFERHQVPEHPPSRWIGERLPEGGRLGFDPMLHRSAEVERLRRACAKRGGEAVALLDANPVDRVWANRPPAPVASVRPLDVEYAGETAEDKRTRMGVEVKRAGADALVLTAPDSIAWLLNLRGGDVPYNPLALAFAVLHADGAVELFIDPRKLPDGLGNTVVVRPIGAFGDGLDDIGRLGLSVLADPAQVSFGVIERLRAAGARIVEEADPCVLAKACKNPVELDGARSAQRRDGAALCRFLRWLEAETPKGTVTELEAAERLDAERARDPLYRGPSFPTISGAGPNGAIVHYRVTPASDRRLEPGSLYLVDSGGQYLDATTDVTRTVAVGEHPTDEMRRRFTLVLKGHIAVARAVFPTGTTGGQLDTLARTALWRAGLDFDHGTGHGVGSYLCVHEGPQRISKAGGGVPLKSGMILSNEPGCYKAGAYGIRTENLVAVVAGPKPEGGERELLAFETLTRAPIDRRLIDPALLDAGERAWLDAYHDSVRADLTPLLDAETAAWLAEATAPLRG